jgi:hypothetical protein
VSLSQVSILLLTVHTSLAVQMFRSMDATHPDSVKRVRPPKMTMPNTLAALPNSQYATELLVRFGKNDSCFGFVVAVRSEKRARPTENNLLETPVFCTWTRFDGCAAVGVRWKPCLVASLSELVCKRHWQLKYRRVKPGASLRRVRIMLEPADIIARSAAAARAAVAGFETRRREQLVACRRVTKSEQIIDSDGQTYFGGSTVPLSAGGNSRFWA